MRLSEPNGYQVDVVSGIAPAEAVEVHRFAVNTASAPLNRAGTLLRLPQGKPTPVKRLAHVVMGTPRVEETAQWFRDVLGLLVSDVVYYQLGGYQVASFMRVNKGAEFVDHHAFLPMRSPNVGLQHISFEAQDLDAVWADHHFLKSQGYKHLWGIGRHLLGSQMFDYWSDPFGYVHEHWADSDRLDASAPPNVWEAKTGLATQWGEPGSQEFRSSVKP